MNAPVIGWHFTDQFLRDGRPIPAIGEWLVHEGPVEICVAGLHASRHPRDALVYAPGDLLHKVECEDIVAEQEDKLVCRRRRILATIDATGLLRRFARRLARDVIHLWDAPPIVREYLETGREDLRNSARVAASLAAATRYTANAAAMDAARAAGAAAWDEAGDAARGAAAWWTTAWAAARAAAGDAARWAAWDAAKAQERDQFLAMVEEAFAAKEPA